MKKYFRNEYTKIHFFGLFMILLSPFITACKNAVDEGAGNTAFEKEAKELVAKLVTEAKSAFADHTKGLLDKKEFDTEIANIKAELAKLPIAEAKSHIDTIGEMKELLTDLKAAVKEQGTKIAQFNSAVTENKSELGEYVERFLKNEKVTNFIKNPRSVGSTQEITAQELGLGEKGFSITSNYTGGFQGITTFKPTATENFKDRRIHMRDILGSSPISTPKLAYTRLTNWINSAQFTSENGYTDTGAGVTVTEATADAKRICASMEFSAYQLTQPLKWLYDRIMAVLPLQIRNLEDKAILYGDGSTNQIEGLFKTASKFDFTTKTYAATSITSIATYASGTKTIVNFAADHKLHNGWKITFANSSNYNNTYDVIYCDNRQIMIDATYNAETTTAWTAVCVNPFYHTVTAPNELDCLIAATSVINSTGFAVNVIMVNHIVRGKIQMLKNTLESYINYVGTDASGNTTINGIPIMFTDMIDATRFFIGELTPETVQLYDYQPLTMWLVSKTDVSMSKANLATLFAEEMIMLPIYNPNSYFWGVFSDVITDLTNPS